MISLITVCYNSAATIADTLTGVALQTLRAEYIIIDGGSKDDTVKLISENCDVFISESDNGLYDALNKGINLANGEIIGFIHADDVLASNDVLRQISQVFKDTNADAVYGDLHYVSSDLRKVIRKWKSGKPSSFRTGWMPPHPTLYVRKEVFEKVGGFRTDLGSAADYEWMLRAIEVHKIKLAYLPKVLVNMRVGGMSNENLTARKKAIASDLSAWEVNGLGRNYLAVLFKKLRKLPQYL